MVSFESRIIPNMSCRLVGLVMLVLASFRQETPLGELFQWGARKHYSLGQTGGATILVLGLLNRPQHEPSDGVLFRAYRGMLGRTCYRLLHVTLKCEA